MDGSTFTAPLVRTTIPPAPPSDPNFPPKIVTFEDVLWPDTAPMMTGFELAAVEVEALTPVVPKFRVMSPPLARYWILSKSSIASPVLVVEISTFRSPLPVTINLLVPPEAC